MAPFVPDLISDQLNLVVALLLGIGFGTVLEQAGFSSSRRLAGVFYGYDFTVLRVFFTAAATAMAGVLLLGSAGLLDLDVIFVNPTWLAPAIVGGAIMGLGFLLGGYCPGTSVCAAAIGKVDAMFFVGGGLLGIFGFAEVYPKIEKFNDSTALGPLMVYKSLHMSAGVFAFLLVAVAVFAFVVTTWIERKVDPAGAPSLRFPAAAHRLAGAALFAVGIALLFVPDYKGRLLAKVSNPAYAAAHPVTVMTADELAFRIVDREPHVKIVDVRDPKAFAALPLPGSVNAQVRDLYGKEWRDVLSPRHVKKVIVGADEAQERTACLLLRELGYENLAVLDGGFPGFDRTILQPVLLASNTPGRWDGDVRTFRESARTEILRMVQEAKASGQKKPKKEKKIQGGC
jgi:rhodanese-related sulfurtransferase